MKHIKYYRNNCIGCGTCVIDASNIWCLSSIDGKADLLDSVFENNFYIRPLWTDEEVIMKIIVNKCPTKVIHIM
jgi:ferredoxin